jgi:hypothetical protein
MPRVTIAELNNRIARMAEREKVLKDQNDQQAKVINESAKKRTELEGEIERLRFEIDMEKQSVEYHVDIQERMEEAVKAAAVARDENPNKGIWGYLRCLNKGDPFENPKIQEAMNDL